MRSRIYDVIAWEAKPCQGMKTDNTRLLAVDVLLAKIGGLSVVVHELV